MHPRLYRAEKLLRPLSRERERAVQRVIERDAEAELIAALVRHPAPDLLGRHEPRRAHDRPGPGQPGRGREPGHLQACLRVAVAGRLDQIDRCGLGVGEVSIHDDRALAVRGPPGLLVQHARQTEVHHADPAILADEDVVRLEVAMGDAGRMGRLEAATGRDEPAEDLAPAIRSRQVGRFPEPARQCLTPDQLHRDEQPAVVGAGVVDLDDVGVIDLRQRLGLAEHQLVGRGDVGAVPHELERDPAIEPVIVGRVDLAHRARAQPLQEDEAADPDRLDPLLKQRRADLLLVDAGRHRRDRRLGQGRKLRIVRAQLELAGGGRRGRVNLGAASAVRGRCRRRGRGLLRGAHGNGSSVFRWISYRRESTWQCPLAGNRSRRSRYFFVRLRASFS